MKGLEYRLLGFVAMALAPLIVTLVAWPGWWAWTALGLPAISFPTFVVVTIGAILALRLNVNGLLK